ncbi:MAG: type II secretion system F family protein [Bacteroidetes bacterium]|nr:type II secretion system F family protein [Bacteroidota bacterium]GIK68945.1 MAG: general secretion pathway protein GspF [Bacteroidota bacterium]
MSIDIKRASKNTNHSTSNKNLTGNNSFLNKEISFKTGLSDKKKLHIYAELSMLLSSGIDIKSALEILSDSFKSKKDKQLLNTITGNVVAGKTVSDALKETEKFSDYEFYSIKIGEESGNLVTVLNDLTAYYKTRIEQKRKLISAFSYPFIVLITAIVTVTFMLRFIVPMFEDVFKRFGGELPPLTAMIISISETVGKYGYWVFIFGIFLTIIFYIYRKREIMRKNTSKIILSLPLIGNLVKMAYLARFCNAMALLIEAKNPLLQALELAKKMSNFYPLEKALDKIEENVLHGMNLHKSMQQFSLFDSKMISLIKVGEEVNKLDIIFKQLNKQYSEEVEHKSQVLGTILEPVLIIFIGIFVAIILIAMYLPLFQLSSGI